jgi:Uma2 family endonuclease
MSALAKPRLTPEEYLARERKAEFKSEYFAGETFAMAGTSMKHSLIVANVVGELRPQLKRRPCHVYPTDMRVKVSPTGLYTYPDVTVVCGKPQFEDEKEDIVLNPTVVFEVLSESTEDYDRGRKFVHYRTIESLREYVLIAQDECRVERFERQPDSSWLLSVTDRMEDTLRLPAIGCELPLAEIYHKVEFPAEQRPAV